VEAAPVEVAVGALEAVVEAVTPEVVGVAHATEAALPCPGEVADITTTAELGLVPVDTRVEEIMATIKKR